MSEMKNTATDPRTIAAVLLDRWVKSVPYNEVGTVIYEAYQAVGEPVPTHNIPEVIALVQAQIASAEVTITWSDAR